MRERKGFEMVKIEDLTEEELQAMRIGPDDEAWFAKQAQAAESVPLGIELTGEEAAQIKADTEAVFAQMQAVDLGGLPNADSLDTPWGLEDMPDDWQSLLEAEGLSVPGHSPINAARVFPGCFRKGRILTGL